MIHNVASTILQQLGGNRFIAMTGARKFVGSETGLGFVLPKQSGPGKINMVNVALQPNDTYKVKFLRWDKRSIKVEPVSEFEDVYADQLQLIFTRETGLATRL